ncbi:hypothetical protein RIF29_40449 [Crotalaria pallida]|uniref:Uncharacterized protein n=1 Tax=Crotalaria pallida TaxID=3830 RepID=A0AAN9E9G7_CROPI
MPTVRSIPITLFSITSFFLFRDFFSLAHSLFTRVANLRASRGDIDGAARARAIAKKLELGLGFGFWRIVLWLAPWNWRDFSVTELYGVVLEMIELVRGLSELTRLESEAERPVWVSPIYQNVLALFKSVFRKLLKAFGQSGLLREVVETLQKEVVEGGLIRDCLELGSNDLKALIQVAKNLVLEFFPASNKDPNSN